MYTSTPVQGFLVPGLQSLWVTVVRNMETCRYIVLVFFAFSLGCSPILATTDGHNSTTTEISSTTATPKGNSDYLKDAQGNMQKIRDGKGSGSPEDDLKTVLETRAELEKRLETATGEEKKELEKANLEAYNLQKELEGKIPATAAVPPTESSSSSQTGSSSSGSFASTLAAETATESSAAASTGASAAPAQFAVPAAAPQVAPATAQQQISASLQSSTREIPKVAETTIPRYTPPTQTASPAVSTTPAAVTAGLTSTLAGATKTESVTPKVATQETTVNLVERSEAGRPIDAEQVSTSYSDLPLSDLPADTGPVVNVTENFPSSSQGVLTGGVLSQSNSSQTLDLEPPAPSQEYVQAVPEPKALDNAEMLASAASRVIETEEEVLDEVSTTGLFASERVGSLSRGGTTEQLRSVTESEEAETEQSDLLSYTASLPDSDRTDKPLLQ